MSAFLAFALAVTAVNAVRPPAARATPAPRRGGILRLMLREDLPQGFAIHETATNSTVWPSLPCFNNLVTFQPLKPVERPDTIVGDLAERWAWTSDYRALTFTLRRHVRWHDGQPLTAKDVKYTFDMVREAPEASARLRINPRKDWYAAVEAIDVPDPYTVTFRLRRPQPSLLMMLASGYSPVYPAHIAPAEFRTRCVGTGPFRLKEWRKGEYVEYVRNPEYFVPGRPYLDGLRYVVIAERGTRFAALQAGQLDAAMPAEGTRTIVEQLKAAAPRMVVSEINVGVNDNLLLNTKRPPFNDVQVRRALSLAVDRRAYVRAVHQGGAVVGAALSPPPTGAWGLPAADLEGLPGYGRPADDKARARKLLADAGYGPGRPLRVEVATRAISLYVDFASFVINELRQVGIDGTLRQVETAQWHPLVTRREFEIAANLTGLGVDDPDANLYENYACGSPRNYGDYCDDQVMQLVEQQSREIDPKKRLAIVWQIQRKLEADAARPMMGWRLDYFAQWPYVRNLVPHHSAYNWSRMQDVWLDR
ncbi:MAG: peptide ABC transporter substrate-binding protein [Candidatus Rokuibacteriota bacterium]|nr:MAG: peptide ABC transporter substrate-binding protein [Candidatus Rokubacteria bacterium]